MSRHRNVRGMDYTEDYEGYDDVYGHSVDDDCGSISPTDAQQWIFDREKGAQSISEFIKTHRDIEEEDEDEENEEYRRHRRDSEVFHLDTLQLNDVDRAKLVSCLEEIHNVVGESFSEKYLVDIVMEHQFDVEKCLNAVLNAPETKKNVAQENVAGKAAEPSISFTKAETSEKDEIQVKLKGLSIQPKKTSGFVLPKMQKGSPSSFALPKLNQSPLSSLESKPKSNENSFKDLSELMSSHLQSSGGNVSLGNNTSKITLGGLSMIKFKPKAKPSPPVSITTDDIIDLTSTLVLEDSPMTFSPSLTLKKKHNDQISEPILQFPASTLNEVAFDVRCVIDVSHLNRQQINVRQRKCSDFGRLVCISFKKKKIPIITSVFPRKHNLNCFDFKIPSPDDVILKEIRKWRPA